METLDMKIAALEAEIQKYRNQYDAATNSTRADLLLRCIITTSETLNRLLEEKNRIGK
jgi:hypothetical protein